MLRRCFQFSFLLVAVVIAGCATPKNFYPVGLWGATTPADIALAADAGFSFVRSAATADNLNTARRLGVKMLAPVGALAGTNFNRLSARQLVRQFDGHPALHSWYISDEPDLWNIAPTTVAQAHRTVRSVGRKPTILTVGIGSSAQLYRDCADILMVDRYPINWRPISTAAQNYKWTRLAARPGQPFYAVIQAFNWRYYPQFVTGDASRLRAPSEAELRCMSYMALVEGANGILFYTLRDAAWNMNDHPETWRALTNVVSEIRARQPLFEAKHQWWPHQVSYAAGSNPENEVGEPALGVAYVKVERGNDTVAAGDYLIAVNTTSLDIPASIRLPEYTGGLVPILGGEFAMVYQGGIISAEFRPLEVQIYGPL